MRVPYTWLNDYVPVACTAEQLAERLTMAGLEVEEMLDVEGEAVMNVKVTSNRGDALSLVGIAREAAALTGVRIIPPPTDLVEAGPAIDTLATVIVEAPDLCPRYAARVIRGVNIGPSPDWVRQRLTQAGVRPINNVVDATNYVMLELGQPLHAFDLTMLAGQTIVVRRARDGEPFTTLDGQERTLTNAQLVIADPEKPVALAGIMGGLNSEVTEGTRDVLLESAHFDRTAIRKTARAHGMSTESSYRFERIVDPGGAVRAADRAAALIAKWAGGVVATGVIDVVAPMVLTRTIAARPARINRVLGTDIPRETMVRILTALELDVTDTGGEALTVVVPSFRPDLFEEQDLIEEVARIHGYEHIPTTVPGHVTGAGRLAPEMAFETRVRELLTGAGLFEGLSYSLIDARSLDAMRLEAGTPERDGLVGLRNPKSEEYTHLRPTMLVSMLESLRNNARRGLEDVQVFELGRIFRNTGGSLRFDYHPHDRIDHDVRVQGAELLPLEQRSAGLALMGRPWTSRWGGGDAEVDFFWLKGVVAQVLADLGVPDVTYRPAGHPTFHPGRCAEVLSGDKPIGLLGEAHPRVSAAFDLPRRAYLAELNVDALMMLADAERERPSLSRFPAVDRDVACLVPVAVQAERVQEEIGAAAGTYKESVALFDVYQGANIPQGWRSLAYRITFRAADRTLEDAEVDDAMTRVRRALVDQVGATLR